MALNQVGCGGRKKKTNNVKMYMNMYRSPSPQRIVQPMYMQQPMMYRSPSPIIARIQQPMSPIMSPMRSPVMSPIHSPMLSPVRSPMVSPIHTPVMQSPFNSHSNTPRRIVHHSPVIRRVSPQVQVPYRSPLHTPKRQPIVHVRKPMPPMRLPEPAKPIVPKLDLSTTRPLYLSEKTILPERNRQTTQHLPDYPDLEDWDPLPTKILSGKSPEGYYDPMPTTRLSGAPEYYDPLPTTRLSGASEYHDPLPTTRLSHAQ